MILTQDEILKRINNYKLEITNINYSNLNPNSYDLTLANSLLMYTDPLLDSKSKPHTTKIDIPEEGLVLKPNEIYLMSSVEMISFKETAGIVYGKSSLGRLGLIPNTGAGFIDVGYEGNITLPVTVIRPVRIYRGMKICQVAFYDVKGEITRYTGQYQGSNGASGSKGVK